MSYVLCYINIILLFSFANSVSNKKMRLWCIFDLPVCVCEGAGPFTHTRLLHACNTHMAEMAERTKRSKVWLYFTRLDVDNARCQKCNKPFTCKGGNASNLSKHLAKVHHIQTEKCTVFDSLSVAPCMLCMLAATHRVNYIIQTWVND